MSELLCLLVYVVYLWKDAQNIGLNNIGLGEILVNLCETSGKSNVRVAFK
jgi:hypothetical protein